MIERLLAARGEFLAFLEKQLRDRTLAEDLLQEAFARALERAEQVRDEESVRAWFYRLLRRAVIDQQRRAGAAARRLERLAEALSDDAREGAARDEGLARELESAVCACVTALAGTLKPEYARALQRVDVEGARVQDFAAETGIAPGNASVRLFRARAALRERVQSACGACAEHGCLDCTCRRAPGA
jgi:RNA polymerase sigma-70 factor (ECF subfamily)